MNDTPTGYAKDLDAAVRERQDLTVTRSLMNTLTTPHRSSEMRLVDAPKVRIVVPPRYRIYSGDDGDGHTYDGEDVDEDGRWMEACDVIAAIRAAGAVAVDGQWVEL